MKGGLFLDVVVAQSAAVFELFPGENESLLVWWDSLLVLNFSLDVLNSVAGLDFESDGLPCQCLDKNLHAATQTKNQVKGGLFLDVVVAQSAAVFELFPGENESLLVWWDSLLVLNFSLDVLNSVAGLNFESDGLSCQCLHEDLHAATQTENQVKGGLFLDVVVAQSAAVFELFPGENESLLVWWDSLLVLNFSLDVLNSVAGLNFESDGLSCQCLHEDLHAATQTENQVKGGLFLDVVVAQSAAVFELFPGENESLLVWWDSLLVLNFSLDVLNGVAGLDFESDGLSCQCLHEDLHFGLH